MNLVVASTLLARFALSADMAELAKALYAVGHHFDHETAENFAEWSQVYHDDSQFRPEWRNAGRTPERYMAALSRQPEGLAGKLPAYIASLADEAARRELLEAAGAFMHYALEYRTLGKALLVVYVLSLRLYGAARMCEDECDRLGALLEGRLGTRMLVTAAAEQIVFSYGYGRFAGLAPASDYPA